MDKGKQMNYSLTGEHLTENFEGCKLHSYLDVKGVWTIGYGHTGLGATPGAVITQEQADVLLMQDLQSAVDTVNSEVTVILTQSQFDALVDFVYNCGSGNFDHSTLLKLVNAEEFHLASNEFVKWNKSGGIVYAGLTRRRQEETIEFKEIK
jgi:lysozyme